MTITRKQLEKFAATRNKSGFRSNLQFMNDARDCGFDPDDLSQPRKFMLNQCEGWEWRVRVKGVTGPTILVEFGGHLYLAGGTEDQQYKLTTILAKAEFAPIAA